MGLGKNYNFHQSIHRWWCTCVPEELVRFTKQQLRKNAFHGYFIPWNDIPHQQHYSQTRYAAARGTVGLFFVIFFFIAFVSFLLFVEELYVFVICHVVQNLSLCFIYTYLQMYIFVICHNVILYNVRGVECVCVFFKRVCTISCLWDLCVCACVYVLCCMLCVCPRILSWRDWPHGIKVQTATDNKGW